MPGLEPITGCWAAPLVQPDPGGFGDSRQSDALSGFIFPAVDRAVRPLPETGHRRRGSDDPQQCITTGVPGFVIVRQTQMDRSGNRTVPSRRWHLYGRLTVPLPDATPTEPVISTSPASVDACPVCSDGAEIVTAQHADPESTARYAAELDRHGHAQAAPVATLIPHLPGTFEDAVRDLWAREAITARSRIVSGRLGDDSFVEALLVSEASDIDRLVTQFGRHHAIVLEDCSQFEALRTRARKAGHTSLSFMTAIFTAGEFGLDLGWLNPIFSIPPDLSVADLAASVAPVLAVAASCDSPRQLQEAIRVSCHAGVPAFGIWDGGNRTGCVMHPLDHDPLSGTFESAPATWRRCAPVLACNLLLKPVLQPILSNSSLGTSPVALATSLPEFERLCTNHDEPDRSRLGLLFGSTSTCAVPGALEGPYDSRLPAQSMCIRPPVPGGLVCMPL